MRTTSEETKRNDRRIIEAAVRVFSQKGFEAASMQDIADEAQISRGPLYYRYKTKKEIFLAAMETYFQQELVAQMEMLRQNLPVSEKLRHYLRYATRNLRENRPDFPMEICSDPQMEDVNRRIREMYADGYALLKDVLAQSVHNGELKPDTDVEHLSNLIFIVFDGLRYSRLKTGILTSPEKVEVAVDQMCTLLQTHYGNE